MKMLKFTEITIKIGCMLKIYNILERSEHSGVVKRQILIKYHEIFL